MSQEKYVIIPKGFMHAADIFAEALFQSLGFCVLRLTTVERWEFIDRNPHAFIQFLRFGNEEADLEPEVKTNEATGYPLSLFGRVWEEYGIQYIKTVVDDPANDAMNTLILKDVMRTFLPTIDGQEYGIRPILKSFTDQPPPRTFTLSDAMLMVANASSRGWEETVAYAKVILEHVVRDSELSFKKRAVWDAALENAEDKRILVFDGYVKYHGYISEPEYKDILFIIFPHTAEPIWNLVAVVENGTPRRPLPSGWVPSGDLELGVITCNAERFLAHVITLEKAVQAAKVAASAHPTIHSELGSGTQVDKRG